MRALVVTQNITLDGRVEMLGDWFDPTSESAEFAAENERQDSAADALLVGRQTFLDFRGFWKDRPEDTTGVSDYLNAVEKYVVSSTLTEPEWEPTTILGADWLDRVRALKESEGKDIVTTGSLSLVHALFEADLVDEVRLWVHPATQGAGRTLFPEGHSSSGWLRVESKNIGNVVFQRWAASPDRVSQALPVGE